MHNIFNHLLAGLCIADLVFLLSNLLVLPIALGRQDKIFEFIHPIAESLCHLSLGVSIFLTVGISLERFQVISFFFNRLYSPFIRHFQNHKKV